MTGLKRASRAIALPLSALAVGLTVGLSQPAQAAPSTPSTVTMVPAYRADGVRVLCAVTAAGGISCDWDRPTRLQPRTPRLSW